jgi:hypothetical protein
MPVKRLLLLAAFLIAIPVFGQLTPAHRFELYSSPEAASAAVDSLMAVQREVALIIPFRTDLTSVSMGQKSEGTTYAVAYQAASWEGEGAIEAQVSLNTVVWNGPETCGWGMKSWAVKAFPAVADAKAFYDGLTPIQKGTAYLLPSVGPQIERFRYIVVYQNLVAHCF